MSPSWSKVGDCESPIAGSNPVVHPSKKSRNKMSKNKKRTLNDSKSWEFGHLQGIVSDILRKRTIEQNDHVISEIIAARIMDDVEAGIENKKSEELLSFIVHQNELGWGVYCRGNFLGRHMSKIDASQSVRMFEMEAASGKTLDDILKRIYG